MGLKNINRQLERISKIVEGWRNTEEISDIERELVLDKLKALYEQVMFYEREPAADEPGQGREESPCDWMTDDADAGEDIRMMENEAAPPDEPLSEPVEHKSLESSLFEENGIAAAAVRRQPIDRNVILSLYECGVPASSAEEQAACDTEEPVPSDQKETEPLTGAVQPTADEQQEPTGQPSADEQQESTGQPFEDEQQEPAGRPTGENAEEEGSAPNPETANDNPAQEECPSCRTSLHESISLDAKLQIINEVFGGDHYAYYKTMEKLDSLDDLDEMMLYIHDNYAWNPNSEGVKLLIDILTRKFS